MRTKYLVWVLPPLLLLVLGCGPAEVQKSEAGGKTPPPTSSDPSVAYPNPRDPKELWPSVLEYRDKIRKGLSKQDPWKEDLAALDKDIKAMLELVTEVAAYSKLNDELKQFAGVARSLGDVRVSVSQVVSAIGVGRPEMFGEAGRDLDQALRSMEKRHPEGYFPVSVGDRPDYAAVRGF